MKKTLTGRDADLWEAMKATASSARPRTAEEVVGLLKDFEAAGRKSPPPQGRLFKAPDGFNPGNN